ncbi:MAG: phage tail assembly protein [Clostridia bacterium]|nr:phage tail assembly protein [Clostridia bacterium]
MNNESREVINNDEIIIAEKEAAESTGIYTHNFSKPFTFEGKTYKELSFDFDGLTGADSLAIESELSSLGKVVITPEFSGEYLIRLAVRACSEKVGADVFTAMPLRDYNKIRGKARSFLMNAAL